MTFGDDITSLALDLARSLWAELGVGGSQCRHDWQALDLEALIIFTASLARPDDPFVARTINWCAMNASLISQARLRNLAQRFTPATRKALDVYVHAVKRPTRRRVDEDRRGVRLATTDSPDLKRPALIQLRLRSLVGVCARAEVLRLMLVDADEPRTGASLTHDAGYGKTGVASALESLTAAGITRVEPAGTRFLYSLSHPADLAMAVNGLPIAFPDWLAVFIVIEAIRGYAAKRSADQSRRVAAAKDLVNAVQSQFALLGVTAQVPTIKNEQSVALFEHWCRSFVSEHAGATQRADVNEASYSVHRLALGGWIATVTLAGGQPRPLALSDMPFLRAEPRGQRRGKLDALGEAAVVVQMILQDLLGRALQRRLGSTVNRKAASQPELPVLSREFASELLLPMHAGQAANFSEKFLQRWLSNRRNWHDMTA